MTDQRTIAPTEDPVCGMTVDPAEARGKGLDTHLHGFTRDPSDPARMWAYLATGGGRAPTSALMTR